MVDQKYALGIHTTTGQLGLGISLDGQILRHQTWQLDRELSNTLHQYLLEFIHPHTWQDFAYIGVAKGPGSFTSTRIGMVTARTLGQQLQIPVFALSSLATYAWSQRHNYDSNQPILLQMKATREQIYTAIYQLNSTQSKLICQREDQVMTPQEWSSQLSTLNLEQPILKTPDNLGYTVVSLLELAYQEWQQGKRPHWSEALPFYGSFSY